jgi:creatinine amidohydrolase/Fe(II)-dependent formamide hydrolase-like protein
MAAVSAIVSHAAERAGLSAGAKEGFAAAAVDACRETFPLVNSNGGRESGLKMVVADFHDRVEVTIEHSGEALPTAGLDTFCGGGAKETAASISNSLQDTRVDRVQYETKEGRSRMTLIKYRKGDRAAI